MGVLNKLGRGFSQLGQGLAYVGRGIGSGLAYAGRGIASGLSSLAESKVGLFTGEFLKGLWNNKGAVMSGILVALAAAAAGGPLGALLALGLLVAYVGSKAMQSYQRLPQVQAGNVLSNFRGDKIDSPEAMAEKLTTALQKGAPDFKAKSVSPEALERLIARNLGLNLDHPNVSAIAKYMQHPPEKAPAKVSEGTAGVQKGKTTIEGDSRMPLGRPHGLGEGIELQPLKAKAGESLLRPVVDGDEELGKKGPGLGGGN